MRKEHIIILFIVIGLVLIGLDHTENSSASLTYSNMAGDSINSVESLTDEIYSAHAILVELGTNKVLCQKASTAKTYPASLTKIMTSILAIENIPDLQTKILLTEDMFDLDTNASMAGFQPYEKVKAIDLLYGTILASGTETSKCLAAYISGSEDKFVQLMNNKAQSLGMKNTNFVNVSGLHDPNHFTTVKDMAILLEYALKNETFRDIFTSSRHLTSATNKHPYGIILQSTMFQRMALTKFEDVEIMGGKTGYTKEAGLCLASLAQKNGKQYILVTTGATGNHETEQYNIIDAFYVYSKYLQ